MNMNPVDLNGVLRESWQDSALVECRIKVEVYDKQNKVASLEEKETSVLSSRSTASTEASVLSSIEKNRPQAQLVEFIEGLPIKAEENINVDQLIECSPDSVDYFIEESQLKTEIKLELISSEEEASKSLFRNISGDTINNESFTETKFLIQEEVDIKSEDEGSDQSNNKWHPTSNKTGINSLHPRLVESPVFKCFNCSYQTHKKLNLSQHVRKHMVMPLECLHCPYKTWQSFRLKDHQLIHTPKEEVELHKCPKCEFTSKSKRGVTKHLLVHKSLNESTWYQCPECPFKTKRKDTLTRCHMFKHRKDVPLHKCTLCPYEAPRKENLRRHLQRVHKPKDVEVIECPEESCLYKTHDKSYLTRHVRLFHKTNEIFKCLKCSYQTKRTEIFQKHKLKHENPDKWFSCPLCPYETPYRAKLTTHSLVHKSDNEIQWFHCSECSYKTKQKGFLKRHKLIHNRVTENEIQELKVHQKIHRTPENITDTFGWFSCTLCPYKTHYRANLSRHSLVHKSDNEIQWFNCLECSFKTKHKSYLNHHKLIHNPGLEKQFECSKCCYKTAIAKYFRLHLVRHQDPDSKI